MKSISEKQAEFFTESFSRHGATSDGVAWGRHKDRVARRHKEILSVIKPQPGTTPSLLDVGCGYGALLKFAQDQEITVDYSGVDITPAMIDWASANVNGGKFYCADFLEWEAPQKFDYVVCSGILTLKLDATGAEMDEYLKRLVKKMFELANVGIAFDLMTTRTNYYNDENYYRNPAEMLGWCMSEISRFVKLDHSLEGFIYNIFIYRDPT